MYLLVQTLTLSLLVRHVCSMLNGPSVHAVYAGKKYIIYPNSQKMLSHFLFWKPCKQDHFINRIRISCPKGSSINRLPLYCKTGLLKAVTSGSSSPAPVLQVLMEDLKKAPSGCFEYLAFPINN